jgi:hypothetical protein
VTWFGVYNIALNAAEQRLDAGTTSMLVNVGPILITLLAAALVGWATSGTIGADPLGVILSLLAASTYAVGVLAQKPAVRRLPALQVTFIACAIATVACLPYVPTLTDQLDNRRDHGRRRADLPRTGADRAGLRHMGLCTVPDGRRPLGRDHLPGAATDDRRLLGAARRDPGATRRRRWGVVPARRCRFPTPYSCPG